MENKIRILDINYEEMFKFTDITPVSVKLSEEKFIKLCGEYGIYGFGWRFVDEDLIKYYKKGKWNYIKYNPDGVITYGEVYKND